MKVITAFVVMSFLFLNLAEAEEKNTKAVPFDPNYPITFSISTVIGRLASFGYLSEKFDNAINGLDGNQELKEPELLWHTNIKYQFLGIKRIGPRPWYPERFPPKAAPFNSPVPGETLYQVVYHLTLKDLDGKIQKFLVIDNISEEFVSLSSPLVMEAAPPYKIIGDWEDHLQAWERLKNKETKITPNLVK